MINSKLCYTAAGILIHNKKVLLIKHKKLGIWLNPGGHIEKNELPHQAAQREFFEETGIRVEAVDVFSLLEANDNLSLTNQKDNNSNFHPNPISTNTHWINKENYELRLRSNDIKSRVSTKMWPKGCEKHVSFLFMLKAVGSLSFVQNEQETDGISWFLLSEINHIETKDSIRKEIKLGFRILKKL